MNSRAILIAAPLLALVATVAIRQTLSKRRPPSPQPEVSEVAPNGRAVASTDARDAAANPPDSAPATSQGAPSSTTPLAAASSPVSTSPIDPRFHALAEAIETSHASTVAAFALFGEEADYVTHDATAQQDADRLQELFSSVRGELTPELAKDCEAIVDRITAAQLQLMAFAINRKNRGLPDSAQAETELADRKAFQEDAAPIFERIQTALGARSFSVSP